MSAVDYHSWQHMAILCASDEHIRSSQVEEYLNPLMLISQKIAK